MAADTISVLIIDDNERLLSSYETFFTDHHYTVLTASDGKTGLTRAQQEQPSLILLDLMLPEMNGIEVLRHLKANEATKDIPVIVLTALLNSVEEKDSLQNGAAAYLEKVNIEPEDLLTKMRTVLKQHAAEINA